MPEEKTAEKEVPKSSGKYLLKSKKAEIRPKKRRRPERRPGEGSAAPAATEATPGQAPAEGEAAADANAPPAEPESRIPVDWVPKTELGRLVAKKEITTMEDALDTCLPLREPEIVDILVPNIEDEVIDVNMVQRMTDSGRRVRFTVTCVVGNGEGFVGLGRAKGKEVGPTIQKAIDNAKLKLIRVRRACGSWECGCMLPHTVPFKVTGKCGSAEVTLKPAPQGVKLAVGEVGKKILKKAGVRDVWSFTRGQTRTTVNFAYAVFDALEETIRMRVSPGLGEQLKITGGRC